MYKNNNLIIPLCAPIQFSPGKRYKHACPIPPYILGALIGDGCMTDSVTNANKIQFTTMDFEIIERFISAGYEIKSSYQKPNNKATSYIIHNPTLIQQLKAIGLRGHSALNKFIPLQYKYAIIKERKELMQGLIDTDGYVDKRGHLSFSTISFQLAEDIAFIIRSLGGKATIKKNQAGYKDRSGNYIKCQDVYDVYIMTYFDPELVSLSRKKQRCHYEYNGGNSLLGKRIIDIESIGKKGDAQLL